MAITRCPTIPNGGKKGICVMASIGDVPFICVGIMDDDGNEEMVITLLSNEMVHRGVNPVVGI